MIIKDYNNIDVFLKDYTRNPLNIIQTTAAITMKKKFEDEYIQNKNLVKNLISMNHTSLFEHISMQFFIIGASRSFLAQVTRHRIGSFTSGSQHYQNYTQYGATMCKDMVNNHEVQNFMNKAMILYSNLIDKGIPKEEARQILPNAMENNLIWTINARSLINFFSLRLCNRNVLEMRVIANKMLKLSINYFPELFSIIGPECFMEQCKQGKMSCGILWEKEKIIG